MTLGYSSVDSPRARIDVSALASAELNHAFLAAEREFRRLDIDEKLGMVMGYAPRVFQLETTTRCNLSCPLCSTHHLARGYSEMPPRLARRIVADNPQMKYACLHLMGEPLLSRSLFPIVRYLKARGVYTYFSTNGMLVEDRISDILASGLDKISVSLDGIHQEDLARYRTNADLDRIVAGIRGLLAERRAGGWNRPLVQVQTIMFPYNEIKEADVILFLKSLGVDRIKLKRPSFDTFGGRNDASGCFGGEMRDGPGRYSRKDRAYVKYRDRAVCRLLFQGFALSDGSVVPCCIDFDGASVFGNLHRQRWGEIWGSAARMDMLRRFFEGKLEVCTNCSLGYGYSNTVFDRADQDDAGSPQAASRS